MSLKKRMSRTIWLVMMLFIILSCESDEVDFYPKPYGYLRLDFPERVYSQYEGNCPYSFEIPEYFEIYDTTENCNKDISISRFNASMFLTYIPIDTNLNMNIEYSRKLVYDHSIKADEIKEATIQNQNSTAFGMKYKIVGNAASPYQFYMTDSSNHFLRGALYFNAKPNYDSLRPTLEYVLEDIDHMLQTMKWAGSLDSLD